MNIFLKKSILKEKSKISLIIIISILLLILFHIINSSHIVLKYLNDYKSKNINNRTLIVNSMEKEIDEEKLDTISSITQYNPLYYGYSIVLSDEYPVTYISSISDKELSKLKIINGNKKIGNGNIICPKEFIPIDDFYGETSNISSISFDTNDLINKKFIGRVNTYTIDDEGVFHDTDEILEKEYTIIANYDTKETMTENNICYGSLDDVKEIVDFVSPNIVNSPKKVYMVIVDNIDNIESVKEELTKYGYEVSNKITRNDSAIRLLFTIIILIIIIVIFVIGITIRLNIKRDITNKEKEILLYKSIGYSKKNILKIYTIEYLKVFIISIILSIILSIISFFIISIIISNYASFKILTISIHPTSLLLILIVGIIFTELMVFINIRKILKLEKINL